jgi:hypothetical protein
LSYPPRGLLLMLWPPCLQIVMMKFPFREFHPVLLWLPCDGDDELLFPRPVLSCPSSTSWPFARPCPAGLLSWQMPSWVCLTSIRFFLKASAVTIALADSQWFGFRARRRRRKRRTGRFLRRRGSYERAVLASWLSREDKEWVMN